MLFQKFLILAWETARSLLKEKKMKLKDIVPIGHIRKLGKEGRVCLPAEVREVMDLGTNDLVEQILYKQENGEYVVLIRKYKGD